MDKNTGLPRLDELIRDPADLKAYFKKLRTGLSPAKQNWAIRVHRAISWYTKAMLIAGSPELVKDLVEARLLFLWVALSSLSSRWDTEEHRPAPESVAMREFVDELIVLDEGRRIVDCLGRSKATVKRLIANQFLHMEFWLNPFSDALPAKLARGEDYFEGPLTRERAAIVLNNVLYRIFMLRGQIVHGASTSGSKLNRQTISDCLQFLQRFVPVAINLSIDPGMNAAWPPLCYPPTDVQDQVQLETLAREM